VTPPTHPLAADLLLLSHDDETGRSVLDGTSTNAALAGATVLELTLDGVLDIAGPDGPVKEGHLFRVSGRQASDALLEDIADVCAGKKPKDAIANIAGVTSFRDRAGRIKEELLERLAVAGVLRQERAKVLGLFPTTRWPTVDPTYEQGLVERIREVLVDGAEPDERTAALISLLSAVDLAPTVLPAADKEQVRARAKQIAESDWAAAGVRRAVEAVSTVIVTAAIAPIIARGSS
jgi:hypothetical protein